MNQITNNIIAIGLLIIVTIPAVVEYSNYRWIRQIESSIPRVLRDIAESIHSGLTLPKAVEQATAKGYGPLSEELERAMALFVLGSNWENSIMSITKKVKNASVARFATILVEANQAGGKITEVLDMSVELFSNIDQYREEQLNNMKPYIHNIRSYSSFLNHIVSCFNSVLVPLGSSGMSQMGQG